MAITPDADKTAFWNRIRGDPYIQNNMGIVGMSDADAATYILKQRQVNDDELTSKSRYILIFDTQSNEAIGPFEQSCIQIDVLMPAARQFLADDTMEQIIALCGDEQEYDWPTAGRMLDKVTSVGDLASAAGYYRCGARFYYHSSTVRQVKTQLFTPTKSMWEAT